MNNKKCPYCGFINFVDAEACRKCETLLTSDEAQHAYYEAPPPYRGGVNSYNQPYPTKSGFTFGKAVICVAGLVFGGIVYTMTMGLVRGHANVNWIEYHPDGLGMTVMMPNEPTRIEPVLTPMAGGHMSNHTYASVVPSQGTVVFCFVDYTGIYVGDDIAAQALDAELSGFVSRTHSTLISKNPIVYQGMTGLEFEMSPSEELGSKGSKSYGKMFVTASRLYVLSITAGSGTDLLAGKDKFLNPKINDGPRPARIEIPKLDPIKPLPPIR
jgi:phage FluMu protein Com